MSVLKAESIIVDKQTQWSPSFGISFSLKFVITVPSQDFILVSKYFLFYTDSLSNRFFNEITNLFSYFTISFFNLNITYTNFTNTYTTYTNTNFALFVFCTAYKKDKIFYNDIFVALR